MTKPELYFVVGNPAKHSLSPEIHNSLANKYQQNMFFDYIEIEPQNLEKTIQELQTIQNVKGLSITSPFKEDVFKLCSSADNVATKIQAVSNVTFDAKRHMHGLNYDGFGLIQDFVQKNIIIRNKDILIIGAGGATKSIVLDLVKHQPKSVNIANRTFIKAKNLKKLFQNQYEINIFELNHIHQKFDIIINATALKETQGLPINKDIFKQNSIAYDVMYSPGKDTSFINFCKENNIKNYDGKGMLFELSKKIFSEWRRV